MNITKRELERLIRNAFEAGVFAGQDCDRPRDAIASRADYVRREMGRAAPTKRWRCVRGHDRCSQMSPGRECRVATQEEQAIKDRPQ